MSAVTSEAVPIGDLLLRSASAAPDRPAVVFPGGGRTYGELVADAVATARGLYALGVRPGDHVGILMPNCPEFFDAYFGVSLLGCVLVPLNARFRSSELGYVIDHARLAAVLTTDSIADRTDFRSILAESLPGLAAAAEGQALHLSAAERLRHVVLLRGAGAPGFVGQEAFYRGAREVPASVVDRARAAVRLRDIAMILYPSGTTAHPQGCLTTHEAVVRGSVGRMRECVPLHDVNVFWCPGPLFHIAAMQTMLGAIGVGGTYLTDTYFDPARALRQLSEYRVTSLWPWFQPIMNGLRTAPGFTPAVLETVSSFSLTGPPAVLREIQELMPGAAHISGCGLSEAAGFYAMPALTDDNERRATTGGPPVSGVQLRVVDPVTGAERPRGEPGELLVRGYLVMEGYYRDPEQTAKAIDKEGWLHTGDLFTMDDDDHVTYRGRLKDMLRVGGENVPALEVEAFLCTHPLVQLAEVVGRPDERLDEVPVAFVELVAGAELGADELIEFCRGRIASFKVPRAVHFKRPGEWPMSATKVNKVALRQEVARLHGGVGKG
ncbi:MAG TPA: class I adenylate-forming enzyme family protein [Amycolatopsis sp.]|nr:class I adenylate-forming enzyme family protein [Amycolatopsis sp.]